MNILRQTLLVLLISFGVRVTAQVQVLRKPFKYLKPTLEMTLEPDKRRTVLAWEVRVDRADVEVFEDADKTEPRSISLSFMERLWVLEEKGDMLRLVRDDALSENVLSDQAEIVGWVEKKYLILWSKFLQHEAGTEFLLAVSNNPFNTTVSSIPEPSQFGDDRSRESDFYLYYLVKIDPSGYALVGSVSFNPNTDNPGIFSWVPLSEITILDSRRGIIPNPETIAKGIFPKIYGEDGAAEIRSYQSINSSSGLFQIDDFETQEKLTYSQGHQNTVVVKEADLEQFKPAVLVNNAEWLKIKKAVSALSASTSKADIERIWLDLFSDSNLNLNPNDGLLQLFGQFAGVKFDKGGTVIGSPFAELAFIRTKDFERLLASIIQSQKDIEAHEKSVFSDGFKPNGDVFFWVPTAILPLEVLSENFESYEDKEQVVKRKKWVPDSEHKRLETLDVFYVVDNQQDWGFDLSDAFIRTFYLTSFRLQLTEASDFFIYYSNLDNPVMGSGRQAVDDVARQMRESSASNPNTRLDKVLLREHLYKRNIISLQNLKFHVFCGKGFINNKSMKAKRVLGDFVDEYRKETTPSSFEIWLYIPDADEVTQKRVERYNKRFKGQVSFKLKKLNGQ